MNTVMTIIFIATLLFDFFMVTPYGVMWINKNLDEGKPCYGLIIMFITVIPLTIIGCYLGIID